MKIENQVVLGRTYTDIVTGFTGVAMGFAVYLTGCDSVLLAPPAEKDEKTFIGVKRREGEWIDVSRLEEAPGYKDVQLTDLGSGMDSDGDSEKEEPDDTPPTTRYPQPMGLGGFGRGGDQKPPETPRRD